MDVNALARKSLGSLVKFHLVLALMLFLPAGTLRYWQGWVYWIVSTVSILGVTLYFLKHDPKLIERRNDVGPRAEPHRKQKIVQAFASLFVCALVIFSALDYRWHWSNVPVAAVFAADAVGLLCYWLTFLVFRENTYTAGVVRVEENQKVISTGPYRFVRHPLYAAALLQFFVTPVALGSWWGLRDAVPLVAVLVIRLLDEEQRLTVDLPGYREYCQKVRYRLVPFFW